MDFSFFFTAVTLHMCHMFTGNQLLAPAWISGPVVLTIAVVGEAENIGLAHLCWHFSSLQLAENVTLYVYRGNIPV